MYRQHSHLILQIIGRNGERHFEQYRVASGLSKESEERQVNTLLYCLGEEAEDVLTSTNIAEDDRKKYDSALAKFDSFFELEKT